MTKVEFKDFISKYPVYDTKCELLQEIETEISNVRNDSNTFFIEPTFESLEQGNKHSPFVVITAPGATGKSALSKYICQKQKALYWDLSKAIIGDNYFIGTVSKAFGPDYLSNTLSDLGRGKLGFVIDAFDEAEISCGWIRIQKFIEEIHEYIKISPKHTITLVARQTTAEYIRILLEDLFGNNSYYCYKINFFTKEQAKQFLIRSLNEKDENYQANHQTRMLEVFDVIVSGVDMVLSGQNKDIDREYPFYGYAPVLQAIVVLFRKNSNYQELQNEFQNSDFSKLLKTIITSILQREQKKLVDAFLNNVSFGVIDKEITDKLYSIDEQIYYLVQYVNRQPCNVEEKVKDYGMNGIQIAEYKKSVDTFIGEHPFLIDQNSFASPVFHDYCYSSLLARNEATTVIRDTIYRDLPRITRVFWDFYIAETGKKIAGEHIGILYSSFVSRLDGEILSSIYGRGDDVKFTCTLPDEEIVISGHDALVFPNQLRNISIDVDRDVVLTPYVNDEFSICNTEIRTSGAIVFKGKHLEVVCNDNDKPILLNSEQNFDYPPSGIEIKKYGKGDFLTFFPEGNIYPFTDYHRDMANIEEKNTDNAFLSLRQILRWFRRDRRDSIARLAPFIDQIVRNNKLSQEMLQYLLDSKVLWKDGYFYKMTSKEAEKKGINFTVLQSADGKEQLKTFLDDFVRRQQ